MRLEVSLTPPVLHHAHVVRRGCVQQGEGKRRSTSPGVWRLPPHARPPTSQELSQESQGRDPVYADYRCGAR